jgi:hypothetical protein
MRANASPAALLLLLTAALVAAADQAPSPTHDPGSGDESKSYTTALGNIEVALVPDKHEVMVGEPVYLSFTVRNLSDSDLQSVQVRPNVLAVRSWPKRHGVSNIQHDQHIFPDLSPNGDSIEFTHRTRSIKLRLEREVVALSSRLAAVST